MRWFLSLAMCSVVLACQSKEEAQAKTTADQEAALSGWHYAKYRFVNDGNPDLVVALRVRVDSNIPQRLGVKELTAAREDSGEAQASLNHNPDGQDIISFSGQAVLSDESEAEHVGDYAGEVELDGDGAVIKDSCCGDMTFSPADDSSLIYGGTKLLPGEGETLDADWWKNINQQTIALDDNTDSDSDNEDTEGDENTDRDYLRDFYGNYKLVQRSSDTSGGFTAALKVGISARDEATLWLMRNRDGRVVRVEMSAVANTKATTVLESSPPRYQTSTTYEGSGTDGLYEITVTTLSDSEDSTEGTIESVTGSYTDNSVTPDVSYQLVKIDRKALDKAGWDALLTPACDLYKLEFSQQPPLKIGRGEEFALEVALKTCSGDIIVAESASRTEVALKWKHDGIRSWHDSVHTKQNLADGVRRYEGIYFPITTTNTGLVNVRYRAIVRIDGTKYTATSNFFMLSPQPTENP